MFWKGFPHCCCRNSDILFLITGGLNFGVGDDPFVGSLFRHFAEFARCFVAKMGTKHNCRYALAQTDVGCAYQPGQEKFNVLSPFTGDVAAFNDAFDGDLLPGSGFQRIWESLSMPADRWETELGGRPKSEAGRLMIVLDDATNCPVSIETGAWVPHLAALKDAGITWFLISHPFPVLPIPNTRLGGACAEVLMQPSEAVIAGETEAYCDELSCIVDQLRYWMCPKILKPLNA